MVFDREMEGMVNVLVRVEWCREAVVTFAKLASRCSDGVTLGGMLMEGIVGDVVEGVWRGVV
jgi:hypothetical protein